VEQSSLSGKLEKREHGDRLGSDQWFPSLTYTQEMEGELHQAHGQKEYDNELLRRRCTLCTGTQ
jgi:hypothetical protein